MQGVGGGGFWVGVFRGFKGPPKKSKGKRGVGGGFLRSKEQPGKENPRGKPAPGGGERVVEGNNFLEPDQQKKTKRRPLCASGRKGSGKGGNSRPEPGGGGRGKFSENPRNGRDAVPHKGAMGGSTRGGKGER